MKTKEQIADEMIASLNVINPNIGTNVGSVARDLAIDNVAIILSQEEANLDQAKKGYSINYIDTMTPNQLDDLAANYSLVRLTGTQATGTVTFYKTELFDETIGLLDGSGGVIVTGQDQAGNSYDFTTLETAIFNSKTPYNLITNRYEISVPIKANRIGSGYNLNAQTIISLKGNYKAGVINYSALTSGTNIESDTQYVTRIKEAVKTKQLGTVPFYKSTVLDNFANVTEVAVVDKSLLLSTNANLVKLIIRGVELANSLSTVVYLGTPIEIADLVSVAMIANNTQNTFYVNDTDFVIEGDKITFLNGIENPPVINDSLTLNSVINSLPQSIVDYFTNNDLLLFNQSIEVSLAQPKLFSITGTIKLTTNVTSATASYQNFLVNLKSSIVQYVASQSLNARLDTSDMIYFLLNTYDTIDGITLSFDGKQSISSTVYSYLSVEIENIDITLGV